MKTKLLSISFIAAFLLLFSAVPAFASTKNQSQNNDHSVNFTQGKSKSDPDDNGKGPDRSNGGYDKPGYSGGVDSDRDGNNGCGNDTDREDDNEGWCGQKPKKEKPECKETCSIDKDKEKDKDCEKTCDKDKNHSQNCGKTESKEEPKPIGTPTQPSIIIANPTPQVAGATTVKVLPDTATKDDSNYWFNLWLIAGLLTAGASLHLVSRRIEA